MDGETFETLAPAPVAVYGACLAIIDTERLFLAGGITEDFVSNTKAFVYERITGNNTLF